MHNYIHQSKSSIDIDQDDDQGFIQNKLLIQKDNQNPKQNKILTRPIDFQTRFIRSQLILKAQPKQLYDTRHIWQNPNINSSRVRKGYRKNKQKISTLYECYFLNNKEYKMIYSKLKEKNSQNFQNQITSFYLTLDNIVEYNPCVYAIIKSNKSLLTRYDSQQLIFDSKFQSGNLMYAFHNKNNQQYHLLIQDDVNTKGYNQWFYFSLQNTKINKQYKFKIVNFKKKQSLFSQGMKPVMFSLKSYKENGTGWNRNVTNIKFQKHEVCKNKFDTNPLYALEFTIQSQYQDDYIFLAMGMPYSYSRLTSFLNEAQLAASKNQYILFQKSIIAYTICNNAVPMIKITSNQESNISKKYIGIMARQHPGETWSSYLMQQLINQLISNSQYAYYLRKKYIFQIFPMINIDGVIYGNFRCDVSGVDLNRQWKEPSRYLHPHIYQIKNHIISNSQINQYQMYFDLHGHSKKLNAFCYSCLKNPQNCRVLPVIFQKIYTPFYFPDCTFGITRDKQNTARAFIFSTIKKDNVLTIQLSFYGTDKRGISVEAFRQQHMRQLSQMIIKGLYIYQGNHKIQGISRQLVEEEIKLRGKEFLEHDKKNEDDSGSQSDPYEDQMQLEQMKKLLPLKVRVLIQFQQKQKKSKNKQRLELFKTKKPISLIKQIKLQKKLVLQQRKSDFQSKISAEIKKQDYSQNKYKIPKKIKNNKKISIDIRKLSLKDETIKSMKKRTNTKRLEFNQTAYKQISLAIPAQSNQPRHNKNNSQTKQTKQIKLKKNKDQGSQNRLKKSTQSDDQALSKKIQENLIPLYNQQMTIYKQKIGKVLMPRMAVFHESMEQKGTYPLIMGVIPNLKKIMQIEKKPDWTFKSNNIFPVKSKQIGEDIITYEKFKKKSQYQKLKYSQVTKLWKQNFSKYTKQIGREIHTIQFK